MGEIQKALREALVETPKEHKNAKAIVGMTLVDQEAGQAVEIAAKARDDILLLPISPDDGLPPGAPANVRITPLIKGLFVEWDEPPESDQVSRSIVTITPQGGTAYTLPGGSGFASLQGLASVAHTVTVALVDTFGRQGSPSDAKTATPLRTAAEEIDLDQIALNNRLKGLLPNVNLAPIGDSKKFAEGVVDGIALAAGQNANVLPWEECEFENWAAGQGWSPVGVSSIIPAGLTASVQSYSNRKWLRTIRDATGDATTGGYFIYPFAAWSQRGAIPGQPYILSCYARSFSGTIDANINVACADDAAGTNPQFFSGSVFAVSGNETRVWVKFTLPAGKPFIRLWLGHRNPSTTMLWSRFQLEAVGAAKTEPGPYTIPSTTFGAMSGRMLAVMDLATANAVIGNAAITGAKIGTAQIDTAHILDAAITNAKIAALAVGSAEIQDLSVVNAKLANASVGSAKIMDASVGYAKIIDASIASAKIQTLVADKISTGVLTAATIYLGSTGSIRAGATIFDAGGITLARVSGYYSSATTQDYKISSPDGYSALGFYNNSPNSVGVQIRADGWNNARGAIALQATRPGEAITDIQSAQLQVSAANPTEPNGYVIAIPSFEVVNTASAVLFGVYPSAGVHIKSAADFYQGIKWQGTTLYRDSAGYVRWS